MSWEGQACPTGKCRIQGLLPERVACAVTQKRCPVLDSMLCSSGLETGS